MGLGSGVPIQSANVRSAKSARGKRRPGLEEERGHVDPHQDLLGDSTIISPTIISDKPLTCHLETLAGRVKFKGCS